MAYSVVTNYQTTLAAPMTSTQLTCVVNSILTNDYTPHTITTSEIGDGWYLTIAPGTSREEIIKVTAVAAGTGNGGTFTIATLGRGLAYYGATDAQVTGNAYDHNPGDIVILSNTKNFENRQVNLEGDQTIDDVKTFTSSPIVPTPTASELSAAASVEYVNNTAYAGAPDASTTVKGIVEQATTAEITAGSSTGGTGAKLFSTPADMAAQIQAGSWLYFVEDGSGSDDTYTANLTPALTAYTAGQRFIGKFTVANTGACTLNLNGLGAKTMKKYVAGALADFETGDIIANQPLSLEYDGTYFVLQSTPASLPNTTNLGLVSSYMSTLANSQTSDATALHSHPQVFNSAFILDTGLTNNKSTVPAGFSDGTPKVIAVGMFDPTANQDYIQTFEISADVGTGFFVKASQSLTGTAAGRGVVGIGTAVWSANSSATAGNRIRKNGTTVTISGTTPGGSILGLGHDSTNSYLLVLDTTTTVKRYSGISGTTITYVDTITLDTAISGSGALGFLYDNTNQQYIGLDVSANLIRRFNSAGTTVDTVPYTFDDTNVVGVCFVKNRVHIIVAVITPAGGKSGCMLSFVPTNMTR